MDSNFKDFISAPSFRENILLANNVSFPKISIITPSYNQGNYLEKSILSVLNQNYPNLEYIIIDGGSSDDSVNIIKKYQKYIAYWVSEKDNGQSDALNKGFSVATGAIVNEQDADDIFLPGAFNKVAQAFGENSNIDIIYGNRLDIDEKDNVIGESIFTRFSPLVYRYDGMSVGAQSAFWKRNLFSTIGMYNNDYTFSMDYDFFMRAIASKAKFKYIPYYFSAMRRHQGSKTTVFLNTPPHQKECATIDERYGRKKFLNIPMKIYSLAFRSINYILQGDGGYVFRGIRRRLGINYRKLIWK